ncbi:MAG: diguanylate cyclase domain-containing protein, partial [Janthinobacterium lividum]
VAVVAAVRAQAVDAVIDLVRGDGRAMVVHVDGVSTPDGGAGLVLRDVTDERAAMRRTETLLAQRDAVITASPDTIYRLDLLDGVVEWTNTGGAPVLGLPSADDRIGREAIHPDDVTGVERAQETLRTASAGEIVECTYRVIDGGFDARWIHTRSTVSDRSSTGRPLGAVGIAQDLTETITTMDALAGSERRFHEIFARGPVGMVLYGLEGFITEVNDALCSFLERDAAQLVGTAAADLLDPSPVRTRESARSRDEQLRARAQIEALLAGHEEVAVREKTFTLPGGRQVWGQLSISMTTGSTGEPAFLVFVEDVTARKREAFELERAALHDQLTGLPNRASAEEALRAALNRTQRRGGGCAVLFVDLDHFKDVNDCLGHAAGDDLLRDVAGRLRGLLRPGDLAARIGGDEFVLVCEDVADARALTAIASRVCERIHIPVDLGSRGVVVTASVGAVRSNGELTPDELLREADRAMYRAKAAGRARWRAA